MVMGWDELLAAAVPGTARRSGGGAGEDHTAAVLDAAAIHAVLRRAGREPEPAVPAQSPMPPEPRPVLPGRHWVDGDRDPIDLYLQMLGERGIVAAPEAVATLLMELWNHPELRRWLPVLGVAGPWLAEHRDIWAFARAGSEDDDVAWREGNARDRTEWFRLHCERDSELAATLLADVLTGRGTRPELRADLITAFATSPGPLPASEREAVLECGLDDRAPSVRAATVDGLIGISAPAYVARTVERAERWITIEPPTRRAPATITVAIPPDLTDEDHRDGIAPHQPRSRDPQHAWLAALPLSWWQQRSGGLAPHLLVGADIEGIAPLDLRAAWARRAAADVASDWAYALAASNWHLGAQVAHALQPGDADALGREALGHGDDGLAFLAALPHPWPPRLLGAFLRRLPTFAEQRRRWMPIVERIGREADLRAAALLPDDVVGGPQATGTLNRARATLDWRSRLTSALDALDRAERSA